MDTGRLRSGGLAAALLMLAVAGSGEAAPAPAVPREAPVREVRATFAELGSGVMSLQGVAATGAVNFGIRADEVVSGGTLHLRITASPSLVQDLSHIRVTLNNQTVAAIPLTRADAGHEVERAIPLDPRYFSDYNHIQLDLIAHYTTECEDPQSSALWVKVSDASDVTLNVRALELRDDLALLPAPFFDSHDNRGLVLPVVVAAHASRDLLRSAGVAASWFGMLADYRGARFPVSFDALPHQHALVFATNGSRPAGLALPAVSSPTVSLIDNPADATLKLLVFQGKDEVQLRQAVEGVVLGNAVLSGSSVAIEAVSYRRRAPYDAPRWLRSDRPVRLAELVDDPGQLQGQGVAPQPMTVNLRLPPDLFTWNKPGVPVDVHYRYTAPAERDNSVLTVSVNNQLLRSYRLVPESDAEASGSRLVVPLLQSDSTRQSRGLLIPAFQLASDNQMVFQFSMDFHREANCKQVFIDNTREAIDPDSTVDLSGFAHYAALPNLGLFANAGFPFTRYADLAETAFVLPDAGDAAALEEMFFLLGRMGRQTGAVALAYRVLDAQQALAARDLDLVVLSGSGADELLQHWSNTVPLSLSQLGRDYRALGPAARGAAELPPADAGAEAPRVQIRAAGPLAALVGFESPVAAGRSVVALLGRDAEAAHALIATLDDNSKVPLIRGGLAVIRNGTVQSFEGTGYYYVGSLPFWQWFWFHFSRHAWLLIVLTLLVALGAGLLVYGALERRVKRRLEGQGQ